LSRLKKENPRIRDKLAVLERNVEDELPQLGWTMEQDQVADCMTDDVAGMTMTQGGLELDQVVPRSGSLHTCIDEGTLVERPHDDDTCVSYGRLVDGPGAGRGKTSLPMLKDILSWRCTMEPCMEKQGLTTVAELVGVTCDLMVKGARAREKGGT